MRILLWPSLYFPNIGGLEKMVHALTTAFRKRGHKVAIFSHGEQIESYEFDGVPVYTFPFHTALNTYNLPLIGKILTRLDQLLVSFAPDVLNIHGFLEFLAFYQMRLFEKKKIPLCLTLHGLLEQPYYTVGHCVKLWQRVEVVNTVSNALILPMPHPCAQMIYNGLPIPAAPLKPLPENQILLAGRLTSEKSFDTAFEALKLLLPKYPDLKLTLIGNGPDYEALSVLKKSLNLPVELLGFVPPEEVGNFIDRSTLVLVPSVYESFSLVALEAALRGRPVVASRVLGLKEVIEDQKTGILVTPKNPQELAAAVDALLSHPLRMKEMGRASFERACRFFSIETTATHYLEMYAKAAHLCHHPRS